MPPVRPVLESKRKGWPNPGNAGVWSPVEVRKGWQGGASKGVVAPYRHGKARAMEAYCQSIHVRRRPTLSHLIARALPQGPELLTSTEPKDIAIESDATILPRSLGSTLSLSMLPRFWTSQDNASASSK